MSVKDTQGIVPEFITHNRAKDKTIIKVNVSFTVLVKLDESAKFASINTH
jgi:hypothetical protein